MKTNSSTPDFREFHQSVAPFLPELLAQANRLTGARSDAEDLLQESMLRAWRFWGQFNPGTSRRAWMHRILVNVFINNYRRKKLERQHLEHARKEALVARPPYTAMPQRMELGEDVPIALARLPEEYRTILWKVDVHEQSYKEVAQELACPIGTIMSRLHRARRMFRAELELIWAANAEPAVQNNGEVSEEVAKAA